VPFIAFIGPLSESLGGIIQHLCARPRCNFSRETHIALFSNFQLSRGRNGNTMPLSSFSCGVFFPSRQPATRVLLALTGPGLLVTLWMAVNEEYLTCARSLVLMIPPNFQQHAEY
jgi:hypothetical protein